MVFIVYALSDMVFDPETGADLGRIEIVKARLVAAHVQEKMTIARIQSKTVKRVIDPLSIMAQRLAGAAMCGRHAVNEVVHQEMAIHRADAVSLPNLAVSVGDLARTVSTPVTQRQKEAALA
jgi:hypothetical protein